MSKRKGVWRRPRDFFIFLLLELVCGIIAIAANPDEQGKIWAGSFSRWVGASYVFFDRMGDLFTSQRQKDELRKIIAVYKARQENSLYRDVTVLDSFFPGDSNKIIHRFSYIPSEIINNSISLGNNYFTLNKGEKHGVKPRMGVVAPNGCPVGIIVETSKYFSTGISLLHSRTRISATLSKQGFFGTLAWPGGDPTKLIFMDIPKHIEVEKGDTVVTSGFSLFPRGLMIGRVDSIKKSHDNFPYIRIKLEYDLSSASNAFVVVDTFSNEINQLMQKTNRNGQ